jgi:hypothetical protein
MSDLLEISLFWRNTPAALRGIAWNKKERSIDGYALRKKGSVL